MSSDYITFTIKEEKGIALIAHDNEKPKEQGDIGETPSLRDRDHIQDDRGRHGAFHTRIQQRPAGR